MYFPFSKKYQYGNKTPKKNLDRLKVNIARVRTAKNISREICLIGIHVTLSKTRRQMQINLTFFVVRAERAKRWKNCVNKTFRHTGVNGLWSLIKSCRLFTSWSVGARTHKGIPFWPFLSQYFALISYLRKPCRFWNFCPHFYVHIEIVYVFVALYVFSWVVTLIQYG